MLQFFFAAVVLANDCFSLSKGFRGKGRLRMPPSPSGSLSALSDLLLAPRRFDVGHQLSKRAKSIATTIAPLERPIKCISHQDGQLRVGHQFKSKRAKTIATMIAPLERPIKYASHRDGKLRVMIAGGGIGGLCAALVLLNDGHEVAIFEKAKEYRPFGGPIQIATNALETLKKIDKETYDEILKSATVIGDRKNGLKDGFSNEWYATFDLLSPAEKVQGEPSLVIDRPKLQEILLSKVGAYVTLGMEVVGYHQKPNDAGIVGYLANGSHYEADLLIGSDGIRSKVREAFYKKPSHAVWSGYTCYTGIAKCIPADIKEVGYKVFLGNKKYFVAVDVGGGRIQWYAFLNIPPGTANLIDSKREWLRGAQFSGWTKEVHDLIECTAEEDIENRDLFDRAPTLSWAEGNVCLLGDAAHPMLPNLGQGGAMAIEDSFVLGEEIRALSAKARVGVRRKIPVAIRKYSNKRVIRAAIVQGMSRLSSSFLFQYQSPTTISLRPFKIKNLKLRSAITRAFQGFLEKVAFPMQFEYLFSFPNQAIESRQKSEQKDLPWERNPILELALSISLWMDWADLPLEYAATYELVFSWCLLLLATFV